MLLPEYAIRQHYIDGLEQMYQYSSVGAVTKVMGWAFFIWNHGARRHMLVIRMHPHAPMEACLGVLYEQIDQLTFVQFDRSATQDADLEGVLPEVGFKFGHDICVHCPSTEALSYEYEHHDGVVCSEVRTEDDRKEFAAVQDDAYTHILEASPGLGEGFFASLPSVRGPDLVSAVVRESGVPVRVGQVFRSRGLVSGVNGAVLARARGRHLGDVMYEFLAREARHHWGADQVLHYTMPTAQRTVERLGWPTLPLRYERWDLVRSPWPTRTFPPGSGRPAAPGGSPTPGLPPRTEP